MSDHDCPWRDIAAAQKVEIATLRARLALAERVVEASDALLDYLGSADVETEEDLSPTELSLRAALAAWREGKP